MKQHIIIFVLSVLIGHYSFAQKGNNNEKRAINEVLESWHKAASDADFDAYFGKMTADAIFIGTDASENWQNDEFRAFSKPYFDRGRAWSFTAIDRNIYINDAGDLAWFDELLSTQMRLCRGSGVLKKENGVWKIAHYVLSITIPNENVSEIVTIKKEKDSILELKFRKN